MAPFDEVTITAGKFVKIQTQKTGDPFRFPTLEINKSGLTATGTATEALK